MKYGVDGMVTEHLTLCRIFILSEFHKVLAQIATQISGRKVHTMNTLNRLLHTLVERFGRLYLQGRAKRPQIPQTHTAALAQMALQHILERGKQSRNIRFSQRSGHYDVVDDALTVNIAVLNNLTTVSIGFSTLVFELTENILYHGKIKFIRLVMCKVILISRCS